MNILSHSRQRVAPTVAAALCAIGLLAQAFLPQPAWAADPVQVSRYDDADAYLPTAERKNRDGVRLFLRQQEGEQLFKVMTPRNVSVDVVARIPEGADIGVVLLLGGTSVLSIVNDRLDRSFSFQPRSRDYWWANKMATFLVDAPSDRLGKDGIQDPWWRSGPEHAADLQAVLDAIGQRFPGPLVIQGHSNGAVSLANVASLKAPQVKAYVFSGPAHYKAGTRILTEVDYWVPVLVFQHRKDACSASDSGQTEGFLQSLKSDTRQIVWMEGGSAPISGNCGPFAPHSFFGIEKQTIDRMATEIRKHVH
jgi:hypothetical protein